MNYLSAIISGINLSISTSTDSFDDYPSIYDDKYDYSLEFIL